MGADATARFVVDLDASPLKRGAQQGVSALEKMKANIKSQQTALDGLRASMKRLQGSAAVMRFEAIPKELQRAQSEVEKLGSKLEALKAKQGLNEAKGFTDIGLHKQIQSVEAQHGGALGKVKQLTGEQARLGQDPTVKAFMDQKARAQELEGSLANLQGQYSALGGDATELASKVEAPKGALEELMGAAKGSGGALGGLTSKLEKLKGLGAAGAIGAIVVVLLVVAAAAVKAYVAMAQFALGAADAARSSRILRQAAAGGSIAGLKELDGAIAKIRASTAATRDEATQLATELYRAGMGGKGLEDAAVTIERFGVLGEDTKSKIKDLYEQMQKPAPMGWAGFTVTADMLPRDQFLELAKALGRDGNRALMYGLSVKNRSQIADALKGIGQTKLAGPAIAQMMSLSKISERLRENIEDIFKGLKIDVLLRGLHKIAMVFDQSTASGKALAGIARTMFQPLFNAGARLAPLIEAMVEGMIYGLLVIEGHVLDVRIALDKMFPGSLFKNLDLAETGFYLGATAAGVLVGGLALVALLLASIVVTAATLAAPFIALGAVIIAPFIALGYAAKVAIEYVVRAFRGIQDKLGIEGIGGFILAALVSPFVFGFRLIMAPARIAIALVKSAIGAIPGIASSVVSAISGALSWLSSIDLSSVATYILDGFVSGIKAGAKFVVEAVKGLGSLAMSELKSLLGIASPSKVFRSYGRFTAQGYAQGIESEAPHVEDAVDSMVDTSGSSQGPTGSSRGGGFTIHIEAGAIVIQGVKDAAEMNGADFMRRLAMALATISIQGGGPAPEPAT